MGTGIVLILVHYSNEDSYGTTSGMASIMVGFFPLLTGVLTYMEFQKYNNSKYEMKIVLADAHNKEKRHLKKSKKKQLINAS